MLPLSGPKKQTQNKANFFKGKNRLPENLATPLESHSAYNLDISGSCAYTKTVLQGEVK